MSVRNEALRCARNVILLACKRKERLELVDHIGVATALVIGNRIPIGVIGNEAP